jgi:hypothetical protein
MSRRSKYIVKAADHHAVSRRDLLVRSAQIASVLALSPLAIRRALAATSATTFDFYISTSGSDSNAGTVSSPWAITSLRDNSPNNAKIAGKRVGLMAGTYNIAGITSGSYPGNVGGTDNYQYPVLHIPAGSTSSPTYVASCDSSGVYSRGAATILYGNVSSVNAALGQDSGGGGNVTIDGLTINGNGYTGTLITFFFNGNQYSGPGTGPGVTIKNCEVFNCGNGPTGSNCAGVFLQCALNAVIQNNYIHDVQKPADPAHCHGYEEYGCTGTQFIYNTVSNCSSGVEAKAGCGGTLVAYNYLYKCAQTSGDGAFGGFDGAEGNPNSPNTAYTFHNNIIDSCGGQHVCDVGGPNVSQGILWYNNTCYDTRTGGFTTLDLRSGSRLIQCYNNINVCTSGGGAYTGTVAMTSGGWTVLDYNTYYFSTYNQGFGLNASNTYTSLSAWQSATGAEAHSINSNPTFASSIKPGAGPSQFQLASGSPCKGTGRTGGTSGGSATDMGAWGNGATMIGCSFVSGAATPAAVPDAPKLTVS